MQIDPTNFPDFCSLGTIFFFKGDLVEAEAANQKTLEIDPKKI